MTNPLDYTIQDPEAMRYALMQDSSYRGGGAVRMADGGILDGRPVFNTAQIPFAEYRHSIGMNHGGMHFDEGGQASLDQMLYELGRAQHRDSPVIQATPQSRTQSAIGTFGGYMDKAGKFITEALEPISKTHPVHNFLAEALLAAPLKSAGTALQDYTKTSRDITEEQPYRASPFIGSGETLRLDPRVLDIAQFAAPVLGGAKKLAGVGVKAAAPYATKVDDMVRELYDAGMIPQPGLSIKDVTPKPKRAPKAVEEVVEPVRTPEEQAVIDKFGQKHIQEAARTKKVEKANLAEAEAADAADAGLVAPVAAPAPKTKGTNRGAVPADFYRTMADQKGDAAVIKAAQTGQHLKPTESGYIGAPRTVTSPQGLGAMRRGIDKDFIDSVEAVRLADPTRLGTWYDRAKQGIGSTTEPYQLNRVLEQHGVYSAGVSPESELAFALKHLNSRVAGEPAMAYRGAGMRTLDNAVAEDRAAKLGFKIGEYANKNDPRIPNEGLFGVNDFRRAQGMGYTDPQGNPWKAGVSTTMHPFMDAETALQVDRANLAGVGGRTDWAGPHIQEVPWVYGKAQDFHARGKKGRYKGDELEGIKQSLIDANNTSRDYMYKHALSATHEAVPGASLEHVAQVLNMSPEEKLAYGATGRWDRPVPESGALPGVGEGNRDVLYSALGYRQLPSTSSQGVYTNQLGGVEANPMTIARPLMDFPTGGGGGRISPLSQQVAQAVEQFRSLNSAQEAGAFNLPNTMQGVKGKNSFLLDTRGRNPDALQDPTAGITPTSDQLAQIAKVLEKHNKDIGITATNRGISIFPFDPSMSAQDFNKIFTKKVKQQINDIYPAEQVKAVTSTGYVPGVGKRGKEGPETTQPFSGEATMDMLSEFAKLPPRVAQNISESEAVRAVIREQALRDSLLGGTRGDIQKTRQFFSEADWPRAVELIRKGATPAAALAALGYSASSMAGDKK